MQGGISGICRGSSVCKRWRRVCSKRICDAITRRPSSDVTGWPLLAYGAKWGQSAQSAPQRTDKRSRQDAKVPVTSRRLPAPCSPRQLRVSGVKGWKMAPSPGSQASLGGGVLRLELICEGTRCSGEDGSEHPVPDKSYCEGFVIL